jgi:hypothetical protein
MFKELSALKEFVKEVLIDFMNERIMYERVMYVGAQASSMRGVKSSPSTSHAVGPSRPSTKKRAKHRDDLANAKLIPTIFPNYIPPLADVVSHDSVPRDFEYTMVNAYLPKGIRAIQA